MNPMGTLPVLDDNGLYLANTHGILQYFGNAYSTADTESLYPKDPKLRAIVDERLYFDIATFHPAIVKAYVSKMKVVHSQFALHKLINSNIFFLATPNRNQCWLSFYCQRMRTWQFLTRYSQNSMTTSKGHGSLPGITSQLEIFASWQIWRAAILSGTIFGSFLKFVATSGVAVRKWRAMLKSTLTSLLIPKIFWLSSPSRISDAAVATLKHLSTTIRSAIPSISRILWIIISWLAEVVYEDECMTKNYLFNLNCDKLYVYLRI